MIWLVDCTDGNTFSLVDDGISAYIIPAEVDSDLRPIDLIKEISDPVEISDYFYPIRFHIPSVARYYIRFYDKLGLEHRSEVIRFSIEDNTPPFL